MADFGLGAFAACTGAPTPLGELGLDAGAHDALSGGGMESVLVATRTPVEMAVNSLRATLDAAAGVDPGQIATVVWGTTSFTERSWYTDDISHAVTGLGLGQADVVGVTLGECGNIGPALRACRALVAETGRPALLVCTDAARPGASRVVAPNVAILSDGAASCLAGAGGPASVVVESIGQASNHRLRALDPNVDGMRALRITAKGVALAAQRALEAAGRTAAEVGMLLLPNYNASAQALFAQQCGIELGRVRTPTLASHAHLFAADVLTGLPLLAAEATHGDVVLAIAAGTCTWAGVVCRITKEM
jgi:3-oxoacyl-[acyl-carrier-protein] synthase-3